MKVVDVIAEILKREGVEFLSCYPTNTMIEAAATAGIRPIVCRQERVGVGIADGFSRVTNGKRIGVFTVDFNLNGLTAIMRQVQFSESSEMFMMLTEAMRMPLR